MFAHYLAHAAHYLNQQIFIVISMSTDFFISSQYKKMFIKKVLYKKVHYKKIPYKKNHYEKVHYKKLFKKVV